jgi:hypothetical protein
MHYKGIQDKFRLFVALPYEALFGVNLFKTYCGAFILNLSAR